MSNFDDIMHISGDIRLNVTWIKWRFHGQKTQNRSMKMTLFCRSDTRANLIFCGPVPITIYR